MKKAGIVLGSVLIVAVIVLLSVYSVVTAPHNAGAFSLDEYAYELGVDAFHADATYGNITGYRSAANAGKRAIAERFGDADGSLFEWMGCEVRYDADNDAYFVYTHHVNPKVLGGAYAVILQSDGTVLSAWAEE